MLAARDMADDDGVLIAIREMVRASDRPLVLAVSGGLDSMVLLDAAAMVGRDRVTAVASFDHRSGDHGREAVELVRQEATRRRLRAVIGHASSPLHGEAAWRTARWEFLNRTARSLHGDVATAHTLDDQLETVCIRALRGAGARGLAGLLARSSVRRPFLGLRRAELEAYARLRGIPHVEDPTNDSRAHLRNRIRHDLLPAIARVDSGFADGMLALARDAAALRHRMDEVAASLSARGARGAVTVDRVALRGMTIEALRMLVPAIAARGGIILDRRGTTRLAAFILEGRTGGRVQLSGGAETMLTRESLIIRRQPAGPQSGDEQPLDVARITDAWRFHRVRGSGGSDLWTAALPLDSRLTVRPWRAGDRMRVTGTSAARRVKRFFSDAGIAGPDRIGWPVVLADGEIVWIPGVRRSDAATDRSGRPVVRYRCERNDI